MPNVWEDFWTWFLPGQSLPGNGGGHAFGGEPEWWGSEGGDFGGGASSSSSGGGSSSSAQQGSMVQLTPLVLNGTTATASGSHTSYTAYTSSGYSYSTSSTANPYRHTWATVTNDPRETSMRVEVSSAYLANWQQWRDAGYDLIVVDRMRAGGSNNAIQIVMAKTGGWHYDSSTGYYVVSSGTSYYNSSQNSNTYYDGATVFTYNNQDPARINPTVASADINIDARTNDAQGAYVAVLYGDGSTGSGGADTGGGGGGGSAGDTYNNTTNNYNTTTTYNNLDLDLSPITSRQDVMLRSVNQIGKDVNTVLNAIDSDLYLTFSAILLGVQAQKSANGILADILAQLRANGGGGGGGGSVDIDLSTLEYYAREIYNNTVPQTLDFSQFFNHFRTMEGSLDNLDTDLTHIGHELGDMTEENGGATLRGMVYGIYESLQDVASDVQDMAADLELVIQALNNLQDTNGLATVRGYLKGIYDTLQGSGGSDSPDYSDVLGDIFAELEDFNLNFGQYGSYVSDMLDTIDGDILTVISELRRLRIRNPQTPQTPTLPPSGDTLNIDALRDALSRLMQKFPFATINNLVHLMTYLVRPAVAPEFDLPMPNPSDWSHPYGVHVDLSDFSQAAAVMRIGIVLWAIARISRRTVSMWTREEGGDGA